MARGSCRLLLEKCDTDCHVSSKKIPQNSVCNSSLAFFFYFALLPRRAQSGVVLVNFSTAEPSWRLGRLVPR